MTYEEHVAHEAALEEQAEQKRQQAQLEQLPPSCRSATDRGYVDEGIPPPSSVSNKFRRLTRCDPAEFHRCFL